MHDLNRPRLMTPTARLLTLLAVLLLAAPALAAEPAAGPDKSWLAFFGRLHVVVLHLPIGLLMGAFVIEFFGLFRRSKGYDVAAGWLFVLGFFASALAVGTGLLLGTEEAAKSGKDGADELTALTLLFADADKGVSDTMGLHMWLGVTMMVIAGVAAVLKVLAVRKQWPDESAVPDHGGWPLGIARVSLLGIMVAMPLVGHLGGNMTHGEQYLFARAPFDVPDAIVYFPGEAPAAAPVVTASDKASAVPDGSVAAWYAVIQPALNDACVRCHGTSKQNGDIRLDSLAEAIKGEGLDHPVITNGDAQFSMLYVVTTLPVSHYNFMPPDKPENAIGPDVVAFIGEWIQNYDGRLEDPDAPRPEGDAAPGDGAQAADKPRLDPATVRAIQDAGGSAQSLSLEQNPELLTVKFAYLKDLDPAAIAQLAQAGDVIAELDVQGSAFGDAAVLQLPAMPKLTKLNLKDTAITDPGVGALPDLPSLTWLNLFGTDLTDAGLASLSRFTSLQKLYVTGTAVTAEGVAALREALPDTQVYSDHDEQFRFGADAPDEAADAATPPSTPAGPVNTACPVSGAPVAAGFTSTFDGKTVGFCCGNCKAKFDADPAAFAGKLP